MATNLRITQYRTIGNDGRKNIQAPHMPPIGNTITLLISATSAPMSVDFDDACELVHLQYDADCHIKFDDADTPVATVANDRKFVNGEAFVSITPSVSRRLAVIQAEAV